MIVIPDTDKDVKSVNPKPIEREVWDFTVVSPAVCVRLSEGKVLNGKIAYGEVTPVLCRIDHLDSYLTGLEYNEDIIERMSYKILTNADHLEKQL